MSLLRLFTNKFLGDRYDKHAIVLEPGLILPEVQKISPVLIQPAAACFSDRSYLGLETSRLWDLASEVVDLEFFVYHANSEEFADCDDAARIAQAKILEAAVRLGFKYAPAFFFLDYCRRGGGFHALNIAFDANRKPWLYEPQTGRWNGGFEDVDYIRGIAG